MSFSRYLDHVRLFVCLCISVLSWSWLGAVILKELETCGVASFQHAGSVSEVVCHPNGIHVLSSSRDQCVRLWEIKSGKLVRRFTVPGCGDMWGIRFLKKGKEFLAASSSNDIFRFEVATGKVLQKYSHSADRPSAWPFFLMERASLERMVRTRQCCGKPPRERN